MKKIVVLLAALGVAFTSCESDDDGTEKEILNLQSGIFISHEGSGVASGSVSFASNDLGQVRQDIYKFVNEKELGTFQQSLGFYNGEAFVVVDNANTVAIVDKVTFKEKVVITEGLETPRYIAFVDNKAYVTNWGSTADNSDDFIAIIDLDTDKVTGTIDVALGPERIIAKDNKLYVSHKGAFSTNNIVSVIDLTNNNTITEIEVKDNPDELEFNTNGELVVLSEGQTLFDSDFNVTGHTIGAIQKIDVSTNAVTTSLDFDLGTHPSQLDVEGNKIYYSVGSDIFDLASSATSLPSEKLTSSSAIYGMAVNDGKIYTVDAKDFASAGDLNIYTISNDEWSKPVEVGVVPSKIYFQ